MRFLALVLFMSFIGCATIRWAKENNIEYEIIEIPDNLWTAVAKNNNFLPDIPCFFKPPKYINIREGTYTAVIIGGIKIQRTYKEYCLNHEVGHLREYLEGTPYHSKYAY